MEHSENYNKIKAAKENATRFESENAEKIAKVKNLYLKLLEIQQKMSAKNTPIIDMRNLRDIHNETVKKMDELDAELAYPDDYMDSFENLPTE